MANETKRQIRWEVRSEDYPPVHHFCMLIVNKRREIARIQQRLKEVLQPTDEFRIITDRYITKADVVYHAIEFDSYMPSPTQIPWEKIYQGKVIRDRNLNPRTKTEGLANYIDEGIRKGTFFS